VAILNQAGKLAPLEKDVSLVLPRGFALSDEEHLVGTGRLTAPTLHTISCEIQMLRAGEHTKDSSSYEQRIYHFFLKERASQPLVTRAVTGRKAIHLLCLFGAGIITAIFAE
jgi:hypothetical protein